MLDKPRQYANGIGIFKRRGRQKIKETSEREKANRGRDCS